MDPVVNFQRVREQERLDRLRRELDQKQHEEEFARSEKEHQVELKVGSERGWTGGWGDRVTWAWVIFFILVALLSPFVCLWLNGSGVQNHWHLGFPPTAPG